MRARRRAINFVILKEINRSFLLWRLYAEDQTSVKARVRKGTMILMGKKMLGYSDFWREVAAEQKDVQMKASPLQFQV